MPRINFWNFFVFICLYLGTTHTIMSQTKNKNSKFHLISKETYKTYYSKSDSIGYMVRASDTMIRVLKLKKGKTRHSYSKILLPGEAHSYTNRFIHYNNYKKFHKKMDSLGFVVKDGDTLIKVEEFYGLPKNSVKYESKDSVFLEYYKKVAFRTKGKDCTDTRRMKYWKAPIKVFFASDLNSKIIKEVQYFFTDLDSRIDSLSIERVKKLEDSNVVIYSNESYNYNQNIKKIRPNDYYLRWNKKSQIYNAAIWIDKQRLPSLKLQAQKIKESFVSTLGWFNPNTELDCRSYFADCHSDKKILTPLDWEVLKYHYSYGICKGVTRNDFEEQHKTSKRILSEDNGIDTVFIRH